MCIPVLVVRAFVWCLEGHGFNYRLGLSFSLSHMYNWRSESITDLCRILARLSMSLGFVQILALPGFQNISRFYNGGQNSLRKPNTNRTKTTCLLLPPTPSPYAMTTEHRQAKNHTLTVSPFIILPQLLLSPPLPLMQCWYGKWCFPGNCSWPKRQHWVRGRGRGIW